LNMSIYHREDLFGFWSNTDRPIQQQVSELFSAVYAHVVSQDQQRGPWNSLGISSTPGTAGARGQFSVGSPVANKACAVLRFGPAPPLAQLLAGAVAFAIEHYWPRFLKKSEARSGF
jgi:hypothetical protein